MKVYQVLQMNLRHIRIQELLIHKYSQHSSIPTNCSQITPDVVPQIFQISQVFTIHSITLNKPDTFTSFMDSEFTAYGTFVFYSVFPPYPSTHLNPKLSSGLLKDHFLQESFHNTHKPEINVFCTYLSVLARSFHSYHVLQHPY